jgi:hypothetical protein
MKKGIYCHLELARFPEQEFLHDPDGALHDPLIHNTKKPHYARTGVPVKPPDIPGIRGYYGPYSLRWRRQKGIPGSHTQGFGLKRKRSTAKLDAERRAKTTNRKR